MRIPILNSESDVIIFYVGFYYQKVQADPEIRLNPDRHTAAIEEINGRYLKALKYNESFDYDSYKDSFVHNMDYLTLAFTKKNSQDQLSRRKAAFREKFKK